MNIKNLFTVRDMTQGSPWKRIMEFAMPMLLGNFAQQLYNTADAIIVGQYEGDDALTAVGNAMPILNLLLALFVGVATGAGIIISQNFGAKDREGLSKAIGNSITLAGIASVIIMILGPILAMPLLQLLKTDISIIHWCRDYLVIYFVGIAGFFFYNMLAGVLRGLGDSFTALMFLLVSAGLNVGLDYLFVGAFDMGVPGVSLATVIAQAISALLCYWKLARMKDIFDLKTRYLRMIPKVSLRILQVGIPSGVTQAIMAAAGMVVMSLINPMGKFVAACNVMVMRVDGFAMLPNMTFGQAMSVYTGQNVGAAKFDRVHKGVKQGTAIALAFSTVITVVLLLFGRGLLVLFTDTPSLIDLAAQMIRVLAVGYICISVTQSLGGVMRGAGDTMTPMWISVISTIVIRLITAFTLVEWTKTEAYPHGQPIAIFLSLLIAWVLGMVITVIVFATGKWKKKMYASVEHLNQY